MAAAARRFVRSARSASGMDSAACSASAVCVTSYGFTVNASWRSSSYAPAPVDSTSTHPASDTTGISFATRFIPSRTGFTSATSAIRYAASERAKSSCTDTCTGRQSAVPNSAFTAAASSRTDSV